MAFRRPSLRLGNAIARKAKEVSVFDYVGRAERQLGAIIPQPSSAVPPISVPTRPGRAVMNDLYVQHKELYNRHRTVSNLDGKRPRISVQSFVAPSACIIGNVTVNDRSSVWYNATIRGDKTRIQIGAYTNVQDGVMITSDDKKDLAGFESKTVIGDWVTIGHGAILHACRIENKAYIGMKAIIMEGAVVESEAMLAAGAVVPPGRRIPSGELWAGNPARFMRELTYDEKSKFQKMAEHYWAYAQQHQDEYYLPYTTAYNEVENIAEQIEKQHDAFLQLGAEAEAASSSKA